MKVYYTLSLFVLFHVDFILEKGAKRKVYARDPIFGGSCVLKPLPVGDSNTTGVPQTARKIKGAKIGGQYRSPKHKL